MSRLFKKDEPVKVYKRYVTFERILKNANVKMENLYL